MIPNELKKIKEYLELLQLLDTYSTEIENNIKIREIIIQQLTELSNSYLIIEFIKTGKLPETTVSSG